MTPAEMAALHGQCFTTPRPWTQAEIAALLQSEHVFALTRDQGFLLGRAVADEAELLTLAVDPAHRRGGIGRALVAEFLQTAGARGARSVFLEVAGDNGAALALYRGCGFRESGRRPNYYQRPDGTRLDALILSAQP